MTQTKSAPATNGTATQTNYAKVLNNVFSNAFFKSMNKAALLKEFDISNALSKSNAASTLTPTPQVGPNISSIPSNGIIINQPGNYKFTNNITWNPAGAGAAITIMADNVILDLGNFTLTVFNIPPINAVHYNGIEVGSLTNVPISTVTVQNGTISGATYYGVKVANVINPTLSNLTVSDIYYINIQPTKYIETPSGIFLELTANPNIQTCTVKNIEVTAPSCAGIQILGTIGGNVTNCTTSNLINYDGGVQGFSYLVCMDLTTTGCLSETFRSHYQGLTKTSGHTVIGYVPIFCYNLTFDSCTATGMTGCCDDCHGMSVFLDVTVTVNKFTASNITDGDCRANTGAKATGLEVYGANVTLNNCTSTNIMAIVPQDLQSAGFSAWGDTITFNQCAATNVQVVDATRTPSTALGYGTGFGWAPDPRTTLNFNTTAANNVQYKSCSSTNCQLGFDTWFHTNSIWTSPTVNNCGKYILAQPAGTIRKLGINSCSEDPTPLPNNQIRLIEIVNIANNNTYPPQP